MKLGDVQEHLGPKYMRNVILGQFLSRFLSWKTESLEITFYLRFLIIFSILGQTAPLQSASNANNSSQDTSDQIVSKQEKMDDDDGQEDQEEMHEEVIINTM